MTDVFDPLATSRRIAGDYVRYLRTTFSPDDPALRADFDRELGNGESLSRGPVLQASAPYRTAGSIADLIREAPHQSVLDILARAEDAAFQMRFDGKARKTYWPEFATRVRGKE